MSSPAHVPSICHSPNTPGKCYLRLFAKKVRTAAYNRLGCFPDIRFVMAMYNCTNLCLSLRGDLKFVPGKDYVHHITMGGMNHTLAILVKLL